MLSVMSFHEYAGTVVKTVHGNSEVLMWGGGWYALWFGSESFAINDCIGDF